jgi:phosphatidylserine/phosphatidylglycerophosphate/cardiolipin synthase-like enzyme
VDARVFSPPGFRPWLGLVPRDHRKMLAVDRRAGVTGGIGIGEQWQHGVIRKRRSPWRDRCVRIEGPAAIDMERAFEHMWRRGAGERPTREERRLRRNGVRIWEWRGDMMHAKTSIVDGRWIRVGSTDFNPLGVAINYELDAYVEDAKVAAAAEGMFLRELDQRLEVRTVPAR